MTKMKKCCVGLLALTLSLTLLFAAACAPGGDESSAEQPKDTPVKAITMNLLAGEFWHSEYTYGGETLTAQARWEAQRTFLEAEDADIVFLQEAAAWQDEQILASAEEMGYTALRESDFGNELRDYPYYGKVNQYEHRFVNFVLVKTERFEVAEEDSFAISDTPAQLHSVFRGMSANYFREVEGRPRVAVWGRLRDKTSGKHLIVLGTHLPAVPFSDPETPGQIYGVEVDHYNLRGQQVLNEQAARIAEQYPSDAFLIGGDLNNADVATAAGELFEAVNDGTLLTHLDTDALDHLLFANAVAASPAAVKGDLHWSDHRPLVAEFLI